MRWAMRRVMTVVLPVPAPAMISSGPASWETAVAWGSLRPSRMRSPPRAGSATLEVFEREEDRRQQAGEGGQVVPAERFLQVEQGENREHAQRDDFLDDLQLRSRELPIAQPVGWHLKAILEEGDEPADQHDGIDRRGAELEVAVPRESHEDIGHDEQSDGEHSQSSWNLWNHRHYTIRAPRVRARPGCIRSSSAADRAARRLLARTARRCRARRAGAPAGR